MKWLTLLALCMGLLSCATLFEDRKEKAELHTQIGNSYYEQGNYPLALKELLEAEKLDPKNPIVQNNLGLIYFMRERFDTAEQHIKRAIEINPNYSDARNNLARIYLEQKKYPEAERELKIAINDLTYAGGDRAWLNLGLLKFRQARWTEARRAFEKSLEINRESCLTNSYYGRTFFETQDYNQATKNLDRAVGFCQRQQFDEPHYFSALAWYRLGDSDKSVARFQEILKLYPEGKYRDKSRAMLDLIRKGVEE